MIIDLEWLVSKKVSFAVFIGKIPSALMNVLQWKMNPHHTLNLIMQNQFKLKW